MPTPAFCRIDATLTPTPESDIRVEVWLPPSNAWNGKFLGSRKWQLGRTDQLWRHGRRRRRLRDGQTDTGHAADKTGRQLGRWDTGEDRIGWRSEHEMTLKAKAIIAAY